MLPRLAPCHTNYRSLLFSVKEIVDALGVSDMTVRRDLEELAGTGEVIRVHGGARSASSQRRSMIRHEYSHIEKRARHASEKIE
ncbi:DeoR family transcriptional regulator [Collinsella intestinalis]|uniref:DeoR family transcriptional regulator n=1 Tax=Collinsella intestinalis TaxID=147207 RepID=UPI00195629E2|nr:DeoR family transcriptional regulator [Collinsella intestinalis]